MYLLLFLEAGLQGKYYLRTYFFKGAIQRKIYCSASFTIDSC